MAMLNQQVGRILNDPNLFKAVDHGKQEQSTIQKRITNWEFGPATPPFAVAALTRA